ncbi:uncharacterized protein LOC117648483 [Thrips palmi]|uniref:Uncharacterized protein LOC117648483 n=1 Tax=Thrips palmi TaxID=161013 RepID=A0A6P8Z8Q2_THRPL|nr:uncharacterized protein LOC117648483 [Thrips palmi]
MPGIPEVDVPSTEPFRLAELSLSLTEGRGGYRISLKDIDVTGVSNFTVRDLTVGEAGAFSLDVDIPLLSLVADYSSSGVLIMIPASGRGTLHGELGRVRTQLRGALSVRGADRADRAGRQHVHVDRLLVDLKVGDVSMRIDRAPGENFIIAQATNMLLRTSGHLVLDAMMPELRLKLADVFLGIANNIFAKVSVDQLLRD